MPGVTQSCADGSVRRTLAIGDIHGCLTALTALAAFVPFRDDDQLITLGDYVDRGPNSCGVLNWLIERNSRGNLVPLLGNHDAMMLESREFDGGSWQVLFGEETLKSYADDRPGTIHAVPDSHWQFLKSECCQFKETATHLFCHATPDPGEPLSQQPELNLLWGFWGPPEPHCSGKTLVCGHSTQESGWPASVGHAVCIDTGVETGGWLTCLDVDTGEFWQANQLGETRSGWIDEPPETVESF